MRRLIYSIILGVLFPAVCLIMLLFVRDYIPRSEPFTEIKIVDKYAPGIIVAPFAIPLYILIYLREKQILPDALDTLWFGLPFIILFNGILYGSIFYLLFGRFARFKR